MKYTKNSVEVLGKKISYIEAGDIDGDPIVFLHGNPMHSYLWRNIIPHAESYGRCIAPDLIGMGDSEKLPESLGPTRYSFHVHYEYLRATLETLAVDSKVTLVIHDWGSALGFHWANQHRDKVKGIVYMEGITMPMSWEDWPEKSQGIFKGFRSEKGENLILERNSFIERVLPTSIIRELSEEEMNEYRRPFVEKADRQVTLNWPRSIPIDDQPADIAKLVKDYGDWLKVDQVVPKLFVNADPGIMLIGAPREFCRTWPNQREVTVKGLHFLQEDSPNEIGTALRKFLEEYV